MIDPHFSVCRVHSEFLTKYALILTGKIRGGSGGYVVPRYLRFSRNWRELEERANILNDKLDRILNSSRE